MLMALVERGDKKIANRNVNQDLGEKRNNLAKTRKANKLKSYLRSISRQDLAKI